MKILLLSAYDALSHRAWRRALVRMLPEVTFETLILPPRHFAWRLRGNPLSWLDDERLASGAFDGVLATSMVDLATLRGLHPGLAACPTRVYWHENQFAYPSSARQQGHLEACMVQLYAALAADGLIFNSAYNRDSFLEGVEALLGRFPDRVPEGVPARLARRAEVLPVPLLEGPGPEPRAPGSLLRLVWNHRWEYDKGPDRLLALLDALVDQGTDFRIDVLGQSFRSRPPALDEIARRHAERIDGFGFITDEAEYRSRLGRCDVVLSTAMHDFQGLAVLEAAAAGCRPLVPDRLAYPEWFAPEYRYPSRPEDLAGEARGAAERLAAVAALPPPDLAGLRESALAPGYRRALGMA